MRLPSSAVVAMVDPEMAENTVPATTATTARRPGTRPITRSMASMARMASPVWKSTSPISTKNGMGVSEKLAIDATPLRTICTSPAWPPSQSHAPITLMPRNANATGSEAARSTLRTPNRTTAAMGQGMAAAPLPGGRGRPEEAPAELDGEEREADRHRRVQPPLREHQRLEDERSEERRVGKEVRDRGS